MDTFFFSTSSFFPTRCLSKDQIKAKSNTEMDADDGLEHTEALLELKRGAPTV